MRDCEKIRILFRRNDSGGWSISCVCYALGTKMLFLLLGLWDMHAIKSWTKYSQNTDPTDLCWQNIRWPFGIKMNIDRFQVYLINQIKLSRLDARTTTKGLARNPYMYRSITNSHIIRWGIPSLFLINSITWYTAATFAVNIL